MVFGYMTAEIVFRYSPPAIPSGYLHFLGLKGAAHINAFFMHRALQVFPLVMMTALLLSYKGKFPNYLRFGDLSVKTDILNRNNPQAWSSVLLRFGIYLFLILGIMTVISYRRFSPAGLNTGLLIPIILYAGWNCFVEETIFRGILMPVLSGSFGDKTGNIIQAVLFGCMHLSPVNIAVSVVRMVIFTFLGWFFGNAVKQTQGLGTSWILHMLIIFAIEIRIMTMA
jgi:membrane protease YdiL (CAAX protease family)